MPCFKRQFASVLLRRTTFFPVSVICGTHSSTGTSFSPNISILPCQYHVTSASYLWFSPFHRACCHIHFIKNQLMHLFQKTLFYIQIKNTKNLLKCFVKGVFIKPYMFRSLFHDHPQGSSFVLIAPTTYQPPASSFVFFGFVAVCLLFYVCPVHLSVCCLVVNCPSYSCSFVSVFRRTGGETWKPQKEAKLFRIFGNLGQKCTFRFLVMVSSD
jgi:hypothetical protein